MKITTFEDWIQEYFINDVSPTTTKDNFEDRYDNWVSELGYEEWMSLGDKYGKNVQNEILDFSKGAGDY